MPEDAGLPIPPWLYRPGREPVDGCWRQGSEEVWLKEVWLPFWQAASPAVRASYLDRHPPPGKLWRQYLTEIWVPRDR